MSLGAVRALKVWPYVSLSDSSALRGRARITSQSFSDGVEVRRGCLVCEVGGTCLVIACTVQVTITNTPVVQGEKQMRVKKRCDVCAPCNRAGWTVLLLIC